MAFRFDKLSRTRFCFSGMANPIIGNPRSVSICGTWHAEKPQQYETSTVSWVSLEVSI